MAAVSPRVWSGQEVRNQWIEQGGTVANPKTRRIEVKKSRNGWSAKTKNGRAYATGGTKSEVVEKAAARARKSNRPTSLRIHGRDGRIQEERTYPRSADPKSSKG
jgi:hypothetical protein